ncbi:MAG: hypothetical protein NC489_38970 [Ruminococcus flavefaciens]|nr:hypothetical protein [Ruminococcus flavefaciens]
MYEPEYEPGATEGTDGNTKEPEATGGAETDSSIITLDAGTGETVVCTFDGTDAAVSSDARFKVSGKQATCTATTVHELDKTFTKYLKVESGTQISFATAENLTLKVYIDADGKRLKVDGETFTSEITESGDNCITVCLSAGTHTITKADAIGLFALQLSAA